MPSTELCVIHPGALSAACWARLASHLPAGTPVKVLELETVNRFWAADPDLTVDALAAVGPVHRIVVLDGLAPGALNSEPDEARRLRSFAMYAGARRGRTLTVEPARLREGVELGLTHLLGVGIAAGAMRADTSIATVRRCYEQHSARVLRDHRLIAGATPSGAPLTVVKAAGGLAPAFSMV
jgi:hypothetical protein